MFSLESIRFNNRSEMQEYKISKHAFVYGPNTVGKTALTKAIDFVLGSSEPLSYQGLDNIDSIEAHLSNEQTNLWVKRTISDNYYYRRTKESMYSEVSIETYKDNISLMLTQTLNNHFIQVYGSIYDQRPTFRSFSFLNFIEEKGLGDLSFVFTKARELKHQIRIRSIMDFFFNYENIEQIFENELLLEKHEKELNELDQNYQEYERCQQIMMQLFQKLQLKYTGDYNKDYSTFNEFRSSYTRKAKSQSKDLVYLSRASFSLSEEIKLYSFMQSQSKNMIDRKERIERLFAILSAVVEESDEYEQYVKFIIDSVDEIKHENIILSLTDYRKAIREIENEKIKIDQEIEFLKGQAAEISYEDAVKMIGVLEHTFTILNRNVDIVRMHTLREEVLRLKRDIKALKSAFDQRKINAFNTQLTNSYLNSSINVKHLKEDREMVDFFLEFEPFRLGLIAGHRIDDRIERFRPGSMARQTHLQILVYLSMFEYLNKNFKDFIYLPLLIIDSANQPIGIESFQDIYLTIIDFADRIGIQTIFLSKDRIEGVKDNDFIDISNGLNKFHKLHAEI